MAKRVEIKCINKNPRFDIYSRITHVGGFVTERWKITLNEAITMIERREWDFYVRSPSGHEVDVIVATSAAKNKYLRTTADRDTPDNLLSLPECP